MDDSGTKNFKHRAKLFVSTKTNILWKLLKYKLGFSVCEVHWKRENTIAFLDGSKNPFARNMSHASELIQVCGYGMGYFFVSLPWFSFLELKEYTVSCFATSCILV